jgi:hypothetical protein
MMEQVFRICNIMVPVTYKNCHCLHRRHIVTMVDMPDFGEEQSVTSQVDVPQLVIDINDFPDYAAKRESAVEPVKIETRGQMRSHLRSRHGVNFYEKQSEMSIPVIDRNALKDIFGEKNLHNSEEQIGVLTHYLNGEAAIDNWGSNHTDRREFFIEPLEKQYGELFREVFRNHNQARRNLMASVIIATQLLEMWGKNSPELAERLYDIRADLNNKLAGNGKKPTDEGYIPSYKDMKSDDEKLETIRYFERKIQEILNVIAPIGAQRQDIKVT